MSYGRRLSHLWRYRHAVKMLLYKANVANYSIISNTVYYNTTDNLDIIPWDGRPCEVMNQIQYKGHHKNVPLIGTLSLLGQLLRLHDVFMEQVGMAALANMELCVINLTIAQCFPNSFVFRAGL